MKTIAHALQTVGVFTLGLVAVSCQKGDAGVHLVSSTIVVEEADAEPPDEDGYPARHRQLAVDGRQAADPALAVPDLVKGLGEFGVYRPEHR